jgi:hypothetical protein
MKAWINLYSVCISDRGEISDKEKPLVLEE